MMSNNCQRLYACIVFLLTTTLLPSFVFSTTLEQLVDNEQLKVEVFLSLKDKKGRHHVLSRPVIRNEQLDVIIKVTSAHWFKRGTRVMPVSLNQALVLQRDKLASNYTQKIAGQPWVVQEWQLAIYPMEEGRYTLPALTVAASISAENGEVVEGYLKTPSISFDVVDPLPQYSAKMLAATNVIASQSWRTNSAVKVGDAIERTLIIEAKNSTVSLLPMFSTADIPGMKAYREVIQSLDLQSRGRYSATKKVQHTYILQQSGEQKIPAITVNWWDTKQQKMRKIVLPAMDVVVTHTPKSWLKKYWLSLMVMLIMLIVITMLLWKLQKAYRSEKLAPAAYFIAHALSKNWPEMNRCLYNQNHIKNDTLKIRGQVTHAIAQQWSGEQFSPNTQPENRQLMTLIILWFRL